MRYLKRAKDLDADHADVEAVVARIVGAVREQGEEAVRHYSSQLDHWNPESFRVDDRYIEGAHLRISPQLKESIDYAQYQVRTFARYQRDTLKDLEVTMESGAVLGHRHIPVARVGAYVPGGLYSLIASAYMSVIPARVAGVESVILATPPRDGQVSPGLLYAAREAGADAIYAVGGVQAIAAMALGAIDGLEQVDMVVGPGNRYVVEAKRQLFGTVGVDLLAGPTEIGVIADHSADPYVVALDLVGQAEHDPFARAVLITTSEDLARSVLDQIDDHLRAVATEPVARASWENTGEVIVVDDEEELIEISDSYAFEHVEVLTQEPDKIGDRLSNYGSLFLGEEATVAYGDKVSGPNHILPTGTASRFTGGLWVGKYLRTTTYQRMDRPTSIEMARHCDVVSTSEGMLAHARTATARIERYSALPDD